jgi:UDP-glucose 4-epimerase
MHLGYQPPPASLDLAAKASYERSVNTRMAAVVADVAGDVPIVFASSADVYGSWNDNPVNEDTLPNPATPYAEAKLEAESALGNRSTVLRVSTVFGPGELVPRAVPSFIKACLTVTGGTAVLHGGGLDVKDYVPCDAVAEAFVAAAATPDENRQRIFNISSGIGRSTAEVLEAVVRVVGKAPAVENTPGTRQPSRLVVLPDRARARLNFNPVTSFEAGLAAEAAWLDANRFRWESAG